MPKQIYDVIVIGSGAGGGMAIKTLCEAGLKVCCINAGRRLDPAKDFRNHRKPWQMKFRGFGDPASARSPSASWTANGCPASGSAKSNSQPLPEPSGPGRAVGL